MSASLFQKQSQGRNKCLSCSAFMSSVPSVRNNMQEPRSWPNSLSPLKQSWTSIKIRWNLSDSRKSKRGVRFPRLGSLSYPGIQSIPWPPSLCYPSGAGRSVRWVCQLGGNFQILQLPRSFKSSNKKSWHGRKDLVQGVRQRIRRCRLPQVGNMDLLNYPDMLEVQGLRSKHVSDSDSFQRIWLPSGRVWKSVRACSELEDERNSKHPSLEDLRFLGSFEWAEILSSSSEQQIGNQL